MVQFYNKISVLNGKINLRFNSIISVYLKSRTGLKSSDQFRADINLHMVLITEIGLIVLFGQVRIGILVVHLILRSSLREDRPLSTTDFFPCCYGDKTGI